MKAFIAFLLSLAVLAVAPSYAKGPKPECAPAMQVLDQIDKQFPIEDGFVLPPDKAAAIIELTKVQDKNFTLVIALKHADKFGWLFGYKNADTKNGEVICQGGVVPENLVPAFLAIVTGGTSPHSAVPGLAPGPKFRNQLAPGDNGSI